jgi:hypothetical protein
MLSLCCQKNFKLKSKAMKKISKDKCNFLYDVSISKTTSLFNDFFKSKRVLFSILLFSSFFVANGQSCVAADFVFTPTSPSGIQFIDSSFVQSGFTNVSYIWNFGDGQSDTFQNLVHTYSSTGIYTACLRVTAVNPITNATCIDSVCRQVNISNCPTINVSINSQTFLGPNGFMNQAIVQGGQAPYNFAWTLNGQHTGDQKDTASVKFLANGTYQICVTATDTNQCTGSSCVTQVVGSVCNLQSAFGYTVDPNNLATFTATQNGGTNPLTYQWSVNNNPLTPPSAIPNYSITLPNGVNQVCLYTYDANQCFDSTCQSINVSNNCQNFFTAITQLQDSSTGLTIFSAIQTGGNSPFTYNWSNGQSTQSVSVTSPSYVCVTVTDSQGCAASACDSNYNNPCQGSNLVATIVSFTDSFGLVTLNAIATGGVGQYFYSWSNGATSNSISNLTVGSFCVTVSDQNGCSISTCTNIGGCNLQAFFTHTAIGNGYTTMNAAQTGGSAPYSYQWYINGVFLNMSSSTSNFSTILSNGVNQVCLYTTDSAGCFDSICQYITAGNSSCPNFSVNFSKVYDPTRLCTFIYPNFVGGRAPYTYVWSNGASNGPIIVCNSSFFSITATDNFGCTVSLSDSVYFSIDDTICGTAFMDLNGNNVFDGNDTVIANQRICLGRHAHRCVQTDANGQYSFAVTPGMYSVSGYSNISGLSAILPTPLYADSVIYDSVMISGGGRHCGYDFGYQDLRVTISGIVYFDLNNNGVQDAGEAGVPNVYVKVGNNSVYTNFAGHYTTVVPAGTYNVTYTSTGSMIGYTVNPASYSVAATTVGNTYSGNNFGLYTVPGSCNAKVVLVPHSTVTPGFQAWYKVYVYNIGSSMIGGTLNLLYDNTLSFLSATTPPSTSTSGSLSWNVSSIATGSYAYCFVQFDAPTSVQLGQSFFTLADFNANCNDVNLSDNVDTTHQLAVGSWDPNNKLVSPTGLGATGRIHKTTSDLDYTINFQNTGTAPAVNVVLVDTLSQYIDWNTIEMKATSHDCNMTIQNGILVAKYSGIMLPDSNSNEPESHGFLAYKAKLKPNLADGTKIENTAHIYFDFNEAVITNTTLNTIDFFLAIKDPSKENVTVTLYPNPFKTHTTIQVAEVNGRVLDLQIIDMLGKIVSTQTSDENGLFKVERNNITAGLYTYTISENGKKITTGKLVAE